MRFRKILFWLHLIAGLIAGIVVLIMSITGVALAYERQLLEWADRGYRSAPPTADAARLPVETLVKKVMESSPATPPSSVSIKADPAAPVAVGFGRERTVYVNPYSGETLGEGSSAWRGFFHVMIDWHRWLGMHGEGRAVGKAITGACNLAFLFLVVSGIYLWWPSRWSANAAKAILWFKGGLRGKARDWNWHNVIGFWCAVPLFFLVVTATFFSYAWPGTLLYRLTGSEPPPARSGPPGGPGAPSGRPPGAEKGAPREGSPKGERKLAEGKRGDGPGERPRTEGAPASLHLDGLEPLLAKVQQQGGTWETISVRLPTSADAPVAFTVDGSHRGRPDKRATLTLDPKTGETVSTETFASYNLGRRLRTWIRWIHTGEAGGFIGQTLAMLASAGGVVLVWTGIALSARRFLAWRKRAQV